MTEIQKAGRCSLVWPLWQLWDTHKTQKGRLTCRFFKWLWVISNIEYYFIYSAYLKFSFWCLYSEVCWTSQLNSPQLLWRLCWGDLRGSDREPQWPKHLKISLSDPHVTVHPWAKDSEAVSGCNLQKGLNGFCWGISYLWTISCYICFQKLEVGDFIPDHQPWRRECSWKEGRTNGRFQFPVWQSR